MARGINKVILVGNLGAAGTGVERHADEPETVRTTDATLNAELDLRDRAATRSDSHSQRIVRERLHST